MNTYTKKDIQNICREIERQWEFHLLSRAVFHVDVSNEKNMYCSPPYYISKGASFAVLLPYPHTAIMRRGLKGLPRWLNQNFIIRLYGILDEHAIITAGKNSNNVYTKILYDLRQKVGAHSAGHGNPNKADARKISRLIYQHLDTKVSPTEISGFNLSIDTVLEPLKNQLILFTQSLHGKTKPIRTIKWCK